jgi:hypothetical protein
MQHWNKGKIGVGLTLCQIVVSCIYVNSINIVQVIVYLTVGFGHHCFKIFKTGPAHLNSSLTEFYHFKTRSPTRPTRFFLGFIGFIGFRAGCIFLHSPIILSG